jgi:hypothetical protein
MDWDNLLIYLENKNCVPIIGAGASHPHIPLAAGLAEKLLELERLQNMRLQPPNNKPYPLDDPADLLEVSQYLALEHSGMYAKYRISKLVEESCRNIQWSENDPHLVLAELDLPIYVTTNYDNLMQLALKAKGKTQVEAVICRWNGYLLETQHTPFDGNYEPTSDHPVVFHLHGKMDLPESLVATKDDYLEFLGEMIKRHAQQQIKGKPAEPYMIPPSIQNALANKLLLFVGHSIRDINFQVLLRGLRSTVYQSKSTKNLTVQYDGDKKFSGALKQYLEKYFMELQKLEVFWGTSQQFAQQLQDHLRTPNV